MNLHSIDEPATVPPSYRLVALETTQQDNERSSPMGTDQATDDAGVIFRHTSWAGSRRCVIAALESDPAWQSRLERFRSCGRNGWVMRSLEDPDRYRVKCDKCKDRFCQPCTTERARRVGTAVRAFATGRDVRFITLTLRQSDRTLTEDVDRLYAGFVKLRRRAQWRKTQKGGIALMEIKRRRGDDGWNVHLHMLSEGHHLAKSVLSKLWLEITGDSFIVKIQWCHDVEGAAFYATKYAGKGIHGSCYHDADVLRDAMVAIKGRRLIAKWGTWRELDLNDNDTTETWVPVDSLNRLARRRQAGDPVARAILERLFGARTCDTARSPPMECGG